MKINTRLLLLTFTIVVIVTVSSSIVYYSVTNRLITAQQNQTILNATNDFVFSFQLVVESIDENYKRIVNFNNQIEGKDLANNNLDFILTLVDDSQINFDEYVGSTNLNLRSRNLSLIQFMKDNPNLILRYEVREDITYYYGKVITEKLLDEIAEKIRANISLAIDNTPFEMTSSSTNQIYLPAVLEAIKNLQYKNQFDIYSHTYIDYDFYATYYRPSNFLSKDTKIGFVIFNSPKDVLEFRSDTGIIAIIITTAGIALALVLVLLFTSKLRLQISNLSFASEIIGQGNLDHRVVIDSKDELGKLGMAFNKMLEDLKTQKEAEKEYTEFITLLNQKPSLHEISEAAIRKIVKATDISFGVIYLIEPNDVLRRIASYGISKGVSETNNIDYYRTAIDQKDIIEFKFKKNLPVIKTGLTEVKIKYTIIVPIIYGNDVVAVAELASEEIPEKNVRSYLLNIREQLAVGIINGSSFEKLEKFVEDLKKLNIEYESQNKELRELHHELKQKADELNLERIKALESTKLKSQFLTNITHELKTPLNSIIGLSDLIHKDNLLSDSHKNKLNVIIRNGKKLLTLINNILEFSKAEAGKTVIKNESFVLSQFLDEINNFIQPIVDEKGLNYVCLEPENTTAIVHTDKTKLEQIIINLLNNAIKFTDDGLIEFRVYIENITTLRLEVVDTGIGIEDKDKEIIFEEFRQADGSISRQHDGTGLGLSICKRFTELLNGTFTLESDIGAGSKFTVILPDVIISNDYIIEKALTHHGKSKRALILENSNTNTKLISDYLQLNDYDIIDYQKPVELNKFIKEHQVTNIIVNQSYNGNEGWNIIYQLRNDDELNNVNPFVLCSYQEKNYGYGLAIYDYVSVNNYKSQCSNILNMITLETKRKSLSVLTLAANKKLNEYLQTDYSAEQMNEGEFTNHIERNFNGNHPDVVFVNVSKKAISIIDKLKHNRKTRKIRFVGVFSEEFLKDRNAVIAELNLLTLMHKHHFMDILKILRDRFHIAEDELSKAKLLIDDNISSKEKEALQRDSGMIKVLIVDDDRDTLFTVGEIVKSSGFVPIFAKNGVECILSLKHEVPDLILLDIMMPKMDGFETLKEIRRNNIYDNIPVVALTAYAMLDDKDIIDKSGFEEIITKPIDTRAITTKINEILKNKVKL